MRCARCDWRPVDDDTLTDHALDSGHPLCVVCGHSLRQSETQACEQCVATMRRDLTRIVELYALLPSVGLAPLPGRGYQPGGHSADTTMPGGDALVLLAPGSDGRAEDAETWRAGDPPSVAHELGTWEDDWRQVRREPAADGPATVAGAANYLTVRLTWAGVSHPAVDEFAADLRRLRARLEDATHSSDRPLRAATPCLECGEDALVRRYTARGLADEWTCQACRRTYTEAEWYLALRASLEVS